MNEQIGDTERELGTLRGLFKQTIVGWPKIIVGGLFSVVQSPISLRPLFDPLIPVVLMYLATSLVTWGLAFYIFGWQELARPIIVIVLPMPEMLVVSLPAAILVWTLYSVFNLVGWLSLYILTFLIWVALDSRFVKKWGVRRGRVRLVVLAVVTRVVSWYILLPMMVSSFDLG